MKTVVITKVQVNYDNFIKRSALESDFKELIIEPTTILDEKGEIRVIYDFLPEEIDTANLVEGLKKIQYTVGKRARGLLTRSRIFGYRPRLAMRKDYCSSTSLAIDFPKEHKMVCDLAETLSGIYFKNAPEVFEKHKKAIAEVKDEWLISNSVFTSGIINKNNPLKYHFDTGNFKDVFSIMPVFKSGVSGGYLSLPEYGIGLELKHNSLMMFDGQGILHGVTPIKYESPFSFRYSIVYYSLQQIWKCLPITEELLRIRNVKTKREKIRHKMPEEHKQFLLSRWGKQ